MSDGIRPTQPEPFAAAIAATAAAGRHGRDLQSVNERLRNLISSLRTEQTRLEEWRTSPTATPPAATPPPPPAAPPPAAPPGSSDQDRRRLEAELALAHEAAAHAREERERLRAQLSELEQENRRLCDQFVETQEQVLELAQRFVALSRLNGARDRTEGLEVVQEVVINLIGSEELAVFAREEGALTLLHTFGVSADRAGRLAGASGALARAAREGEPFVASGDAAAPGEEDLTACIPLRCGAQVVGVIAVFRLLGHKPGLSASDHAVFDLLADHAGAALRLSKPARAA
ncbi:MAG TPA: GAF domain-containing protein [Anaeromyxobacteraceae bacterium]|nr:GAF domain-containing protein [Anaeromyxobacteraceae bacterium]